MSYWAFWTIAAAVFLIAELLTLALYMAPCALGSLAALAAGHLGVPVWGQALVWAGSSLVLVFALRPLAKRHAAKPILTGTAALVGTTGRSTSLINREEGLAKVSGGEWSARSEQTIEPNQEVVVDRIDGATLWVSLVQDTSGDKPSE